MPRQSFPTLRRLCQVWSRSTCPLLSCSVFTADALRCAMTLTFLLLILNICSISAVTWSSSVPNLSKIEQSAVELWRSPYLTLWPWTCVTCCAICSSIIFTQIKLSQPIRSWHVTIFDADTLYYAAILTFDLLTLNFCSRSNSIPNLSKIEQSATELLTI